MKVHLFARMKTTRNYYVFREIYPETGEIMNKNDPRAEVNFGQIYLPVGNFKKEPDNVKLTIEVDDHATD